MNLGRIGLQAHGILQLLLGRIITAYDREVFGEYLMRFRIVYVEL